MDLPVDYRQLHYTARKRVRDEYVRQQDSKCYYCGEPLSGPPSDSVSTTPVNRDLFPPSFFEWPVHLHHNHDTGMTIGAVHCLCNAVLWEYHGE